MGHCPLLLKSWFGDGGRDTWMRNTAVSPVRAPGLTPTKDSVRDTALVHDLICCLLAVLGGCSGMPLWPFH